MVIEEYAVRITVTNSRGTIVKWASHSRKAPTSENRCRARLFASLSDAENRATKETNKLVGSSGEVVPVAVTFPCDGGADER